MSAVLLFLSIMVIGYMHKFRPEATKTCDVSISFKVSISVSLLSPSVSGVASGWGGNHGEAVAVSDASGCHGGEGTNLPKALRVSDPVTQPGDPLRQERSPVCTAEHRPAHRGAATGRQLRHKVTVPRLTGPLKGSFPCN